MNIDKTYITNLINEEYEQIVINELFSKRSASLEEIIDGNQNPNIDEVIKSDHFQESLFKDLIGNKSRFSEWKIDKQSNMTSNDINEEDSTPTYIFKFNYDYKDNKIPRLGLRINGDLKPDSPLDVKLQHEGKDIPLRRLDGKEWMTPTIKRAVANAVLSPYL